MGGETLPVRKNIMAWKYGPKTIIENNYKGCRFQSIGKPLSQTELEERYRALKGKDLSKSSGAEGKILEKNKG